MNDTKLNKRMENENETTEGTVSKLKKKRDGKHLAPWQFKPGQSGNPKGRPKGPSLKEWAREYLAAMTPEEKETFMEGLSKDIIWRMAEGNPANNTDITSKGERVAYLPGELIEKNDLSSSSESDSEGQA